MSRDKIDKAIYDKERYESLRERGVGEDRAKRVATKPLEREPRRRPSRSTPLTSEEARVPEKGAESNRRGPGPRVKTTVPRTGI